MDLFGFFKGFFLPSKREHNNNNPRSPYLRTDQDEVDEYDPSDQHPRINEPFGFQIFSNPIEMQKYFEKQMEDLLRNFGFHHDDSFFGYGDENSVGTQFGGFLEDSDEHPSQGNSLRDQFLKPGYHEPHADIQKRSDNDVDGQIQPNDLDSMFKEKNALTPYKPPNQSIFKSFGQSITSKTIRNSDGSIETQRTVKDSQGNHENVVTKKWGDKEYTVITRTDKDGKQVVTENLVNMDENDLKGFLKSSNDMMEPKKPHNWFPFDKYFN